MSPGARLQVSSDLELGADAIAKLLSTLDREPLTLTDPYAAAVLGAAVRAAAGHPSPQSRMAASGLVAKRGEILSPPGAIVRGSGGRPVRLAEIIGGAEWGSDRFPQFAPRSSRGYWLMPAAGSREAIDAADQALGDVLAKVVR